MITLPGNILLPEMKRVCGAESYSWLLVGQQEHIKQACSGKEQEQGRL